MKNKYTQKRQKEIIGLFAPSILGMIISIVCLIGTSWAWFTANSTASVQMIQVANYSVAVTVEKDTSVEPEKKVDVSVDGNIATCTLEPNTSYSVTLTPSGTATKGYCLISDGENVYEIKTERDQQSSWQPFKFTYNNGLPDGFASTQQYDELIQKASGKSFAIAWYWGEYPNTLSTMTYSMEEPVLIENGSVIGQPIAQRPEEHALPTIETTIPPITDQTTPSTEETTTTDLDTSSTEETTTINPDTTSDESSISSTEPVENNEPTGTTKNTSSVEEGTTESTGTE